MEGKDTRPGPARPGGCTTAEGGQMLVMALLALALGVLLVAAFLLYVASSQRATEAAREQTTDHYSADAGAEHAMWRLANEAGFSDSLPSGTPYSYTITINGRTVTITVTKVVNP